jgi:hypothetical protein
MIWILATRGAATKLRASPFTETAIEGVHSVMYRQGIEPVPGSGDDIEAAPLGTFSRGQYRITGLVYTYDGAAADALFAITTGIDLIIRYRANAQKRKRAFSDVLFVGDVTITVPNLNAGVSELIGVPFRVQIPAGTPFSAVIADTVEA